MKKVSNIILLICFVIVAGGFFFADKFDNQKKSIDSPTQTAVQNEEPYNPLPPTLSSVFSEDHSWTATLSASRIRKMIVTGDIIPARAVNFGVIQRNNPFWPYEKVKEQILAEKADITFANLETPLLQNCPPTQIGMVFCGNVRNIEGLQAIGINVVSIANNHFGNHGLLGIQETITHLTAVNMQVVGATDVIYRNVRGVTFAFLGYNDIGHQEKGINWAEEEAIISNIKEARKNADVVVVMYHWGAEYRAQPDNRQLFLAHFTIDQGADLVVSNHPHWIQPVELYKGKLIMYAHGNFIFDQMWSQKTREGVMGVYTFYDAQLIDIYYLPLQINDYGQAVFLTGVERKRILMDLKEQSERRFLDSTSLRSE